MSFAKLTRSMDDTHYWQHRSMHKCFRKDIDEMLLKNASKLKGTMSLSERYTLYEYEANKESVILIVQENPRDYPYGENSDFMYMNHPFSVCDTVSCTEFHLENKDSGCKIDRWTLFG